MTTITKADYARHCQEHLADFRAFVDDLTDQQLDTPSLCEAWAVRDVLGHLAIGRTLSVPTVLWRIAKGGFRVDAVVSHRESQAAVRDLSPAEVRTLFADATSQWPEKGLAGIEPVKAKLGDNVTHLYDIAVPLGIEPDLPAERLVAVLEALPQVGMWGSKGRTKGLRLVAEDVDWSHGEGAEVRGSAGALILALGGRTQVLDELTGDGVAVLRQRLAA